MLDVGWSELLVIAVVMIVIVGPKDLPKMLRAFGKATAKLRATATEFRGHFDEALKEAELDDVKKVFDEAKKLDPRKTVTNVFEPIRSAGEELRSSLNSAVKSDTSSTKETAETKGTETKADEGKVDAAPVTAVPVMAEPATQKDTSDAGEKLAKKSAVSSKAAKSTTAKAAKPASVKTSATKTGSAKKPVATEPVKSKDTVKKPAAKKATAETKVAQAPKTTKTGQIK